MKTLITQWALVTLLFLMAATAAARQPTPVHQVEGISEYQLKNGLKVLLFPDPSKETVTVNVTYKVGSKHENYGETGMAHLLEHLLFKGSKKHPNIPAELSSHGAQPNGTTWIDRTNYFETFVASEENIDWALSMEADRMVNSFIAQKDLDSEMTVVRNEFERAENSPFRVLMQAVLSASYEWHNNGKPTIGARSDIENVSIERLRQFYKRYYQPDNAVLVVAGKFEPETVLKKINKTFGKIKKPKRELPQLYTEEPPADGEKSVTIRRVGDVQIYASAYHIPSGFHEDYPAFEALSHILGDTPRGRLHANVTEQDLAVGTYAFPFQLQAPGLMFFAAQADLNTQLDDTRQAMIRTIEEVGANPITEAELATAKRSWLKKFELAYNSPEQIAILLSEYIGMGDWRLLFLTRDRIEALTVADVQRVAQTYLTRNNRTDGVFLPSATPERVEVSAARPVAEQLADYQGREGVTLGEAFDPSYDNIAERTSVHKLEGGPEVALLTKRSRGEQVLVQFRMNFGDESNLSGHRTAGSLVPQMLLRGTSRYDRKQIVNEFDKLKTSVSIGGGVTALRGTLNTRKEFVVPALELLAEVLTQPSFDKREFELLKSQTLADLEASRQEPNAIVSRASRRHFDHHPQQHPHYTPTLEESIDDIGSAEIQALKAFYKDYYGSGNMQIAVVGDFDEQKVLTALDELFTGWQAEKNYAPVLTPFVEVEPASARFNTPDKENAIYLAKLLLPVGVADPDAPALEMGLYMLGGGFLNSRIATRLRQQDGLSYGSAAWVSFSDETSRAEVGAYAIFAPQNLAAVKQAVTEEIQKVNKEGFTADELAEAKKGYLQDQRVTRSEDAAMTGLLVNSLYLDRDIQWRAGFEKKIEQLTLKEVNAAFNQYIDANRFSVFEAGDFK